MPEKNKEFEDGMHIAWTKVGDWFDSFFALLPNMIVGTIVAVFFLLLAWGLSWLSTIQFNKRNRADLGEMVSDFVFWSITLFGVLLALTVVLPSVNPGDLLASLGIGSIAIGFAFKDILQNWLAGLLILLRQPFRRGDQVALANIEGTVQKITQRATLIKTYDGRMVVVPNAEIYTQSITVNTAFKYRRVDLDVTVGYDNDIRTITCLIEAALGQIDEILKEPPPQVLPWDLGATSLALKVRWWIESRRSTEVVTRARAVQAIKEAFQANGIDPTDPQIIYEHEVGANRVSAKLDISPVPLDPADLVTRPPPDLPVATGDPEGEVAQREAAETQL